MSLLDVLLLALAVAFLGLAFLAFAAVGLGLACLLVRLAATSAFPRPLLGAGGRPLVVDEDGVLQPETLKIVLSGGFCLYDHFYPHPESKPSGSSSDPGDDDDEESDDDDYPIPGL